MENKTVSISVDLLNATLTYLAKQPFEQVHQLIGALRQQGEASLRGEEPEDV